MPSHHQDIIKNTGQWQAKVHQSQEPTTSTNFYNQNAYDECGPFEQSQYNQCHSGSLDFSQAGGSLDFSRLPLATALFLVGLLLSSVKSAEPKTVSSDGRELATTYDNNNSVRPMFSMNGGDYMPVEGPYSKGHKATRNTKTRKSSMTPSRQSKNVKAKKTKAHRTKTTTEASKSTELSEATATLRTRKSNKASESDRSTTTRSVTVHRKPGKRKLRKGEAQKTKAHRINTTTEEPSNAIPEVVQTNQNNVNRTTTGALGTDLLSKTIWAAIDHLDLTLLERFFPAKINGNKTITAMANELFQEICTIVPKPKFDALQRIVEPAVGLLARSVISGQLSISTEADISRYMHQLAKVIIFSTADEDLYSSEITPMRTLGPTPLMIPKDMTYENNQLVCYINGTPYPLQCYDFLCDALIRGIYRPVKYSHKKEAWVIEPKEYFWAVLQGRQTPAALVGFIDDYALFCTKNPKDHKKYIVTEDLRLIPYSLYTKKKPETFDVKCRFAQEVTNGKGLLEQSRFETPLYIVAKRDQQQIRQEGFGHYKTFRRVPNMIDGNALIASETLKGALKRIGNRKGLFYIYEVDAKEGVRGASLRRNIEANKKNLTAHFALNLEGEDFNWNDITLGATYFDEIHVYAKDVKHTNITLLGTNEDFSKELEELEDGEWRYRV